MSGSRERNSLRDAIASLGWPLILGSAASSLFYTLLFKGPLTSSLMQRYFATHPVSYVATTMFFIGMAALLAKLINVVGQYHSLDSIGLDKHQQHGQGLDDCLIQLSRLRELPQRARDSYLGMRLSSALELIDRKGTANGLDEDLKYLSDIDQGRQQESYSLVRIIIWATPMLGFLGTVIGITQALGNLDPVELANSIQTAMQKLLDGLYVAFDTTALALSLSIVLMFVQFIVDRIESQLLAKVDEQTNRELLGRFPQWGTQTDPYVASVHKMCQDVMHASDQLVQQQAALWQKTIDAAHQQWTQLGDTSLKQTEKALSAALEQSLRKHAAVLSEQSETAAQSTAHRWNEAQDRLLEQMTHLLNQRRDLEGEHRADSERWQTALSNSAAAMHAQQSELQKHGEVLTRAIDASHNIRQLEAALNDNLRSLAGSQHFEATVNSLAAAIHLLNARLGEIPAKSPPLELDPNDSQDRAA
ncbi:MAG: hypothetical protein CMJ59_05305 [Planctomycetaceae bacterium]|nr:hypothetical protein [Planctomycetaceae bacterium]